MKDPHNDDLEARLKRDPRREQSDPPPPPNEPSAPPKVEIVDSSRLPNRDAELPDSCVNRAEVSPVVRSPAAMGSSIVGATDSRMGAVEKAVDTGDWDRLIAALGPAEDAGKLPANFGVLYAIAMKEKEKAETQGPDLTELAIKCTAAIFGVDCESPIARLVAKRLLRKNPTAWRQRPAPSAKVSILIMLGGLLVSATLSWLISFGYLHVTFHLP